MKKHAKCFIFPLATQVCSNGTRVFVHESVFRRFVDEFSLRASRMKVGDPMAEDTTVGAAITWEHGEKVKENANIR